MPAQRKAFTLLELLASIGLIAVLVAFLAPVFMNAKSTARRGKCQSNLSQVSRAFETYTTDYSGCYPNAGSQYLWAGLNWRTTLRRYLALGESAERTILSCPCDPTPPGVYSGTSYAYSASFYMTPEQVNRVADGNQLRSKFAATNPKLPCSTVKTSTVKFATKKALVAEYWTMHAENPKVGWYDDPAETGNDPWSGARNYLFADGHVTYIQTKRINAADSPLVSRPRSLPDINLTRDGVEGRDID